MGYLFLAVVFYTTVKFSFEVWSQSRYEKGETDRDFGYGSEIKDLKKMVAQLQVDSLRVGTD